MNFIALTVGLLLCIIIDPSSADIPSCQISQQTGYCVPYDQCKDKEFPPNRVFNPDAVKVVVARRNACPQHRGTLFCCSQLYTAEVASLPDRINVESTTTTQSPITSTTKKEISISIDELKAHRNYALFNNRKCGDSTDNRIANGNTTGLYEFPWMALIKYVMRDKSEKFLCGGSLITSRYVLTASHCITALSSAKVHSVRLGEYNLDTVEDCEETDDDADCADPVQDILVSKVIPNRDYDEVTFTNDIGLLRLQSLAVRKENVRPICLPFAEELFTLPDLLIVTGFGTTEQQVKSKVLKKANIPHYPLEECKAKFASERITLTDNQFCAGAQGKVDACKGDSGGPVQFVGSLEDKYIMVQYGIVSFGVNTCGKLENVPGIYTKVSSYLGWILDNMEP